MTYPNYTIILLNTDTVTATTKAGETVTIRRNRVLDFGVPETITVQPENLNTRTATLGDYSQTEVVFPPYQVGDSILAINTEDGLEDITPRQWVRQ